MSTSRDFYLVFKNLFDLKYLGFWWTQPRSDSGGDFSPKKFNLHIEIDRADDKMVSVITHYFNRNSNVDGHLFGTPMAFIPLYSPFMDDEGKNRIGMHVKKQGSLGKSIQSTTVSGTQIINWSDSNKNHTLHRELMMIESIYDKKKLQKEKMQKHLRVDYFIALSLTPFLRPLPSIIRKLIPLRLIVLQEDCHCS